MDIFVCFFSFLLNALPYIYIYMQVTNPAIDPLREGLVMSLEVNIGKRGNILEVGPENASQVCPFCLRKACHIYFDRL